MREQLVRALSTLPAATDVGIVFAGDGEPELIAGVNAGRFRTYLRGLAFEGGRDNSAALAAGWDWASAAKDGAIVWIHGPQPIVSSELDELLQRFERRSGQVTLYQLQAVAGTDLIGRKLAPMAGVHSVARSATLSEDLQRLFAQWQPQATRIAVTRERVAGAAPAGATPTSEHLARLRAGDEVELLRQARAPEGQAAAVALASQYQLVTPVSGAVVLESQAQYDSAGLQPVAPGSVPTIPEPETWLMMIVALGVLVWRVRLARIRPAGMEA